MRGIPDKLKSWEWWWPRYRAKYFLWELGLCAVVVLVLYGWNYLTR
jgi:hypothetical protein